MFQSWYEIKCLTFISVLHQLAQHHLVNIPSLPCGPEKAPHLYGYLCIYILHVYTNYLFWNVLFCCMTFLYVHIRPHILLITETYNWVSCLRGQGPVIFQAERSYLSTLVNFLKFPQFVGTLIGIMLNVFINWHLYNIKSSHLSTSWKDFVLPLNSL